MNDPQTIKDSPGRKLAALRAERGMSLEEVARHVKFSPRQIEALEYDDYAALPGATIVRGMVRSYAKLLGVDPEPLVAELRQRLSPADSPQAASNAAMSVPFPGNRRASHPYFWMIAGLVGAIALLIGAETLLGGRNATVNPPAPVAAPEKAEPAAPPVVEAMAPTAAEAPTEPPKPAPLPPGVKRLVFKFEKPSWVEVRNATGQVLLSQLNQPGTEQTLEGPGPFTLVIGAANGVQLSYNNAPVDLLPHTRVDVARLTLN